MTAATSTARVRRPAAARSALADRTPARTPAHAPASRPRLTVLQRPAPRRSVVPFTLVCTLIIVGTLLGVLFLNLSMSSSSYEISRLQSQSRTLEENRQALQEQEDKLSTPQELEARATSLGMVPSGETAYIDLSTGSVVDQAPAEGASSAPAPAPVATVPQASIYDGSEPYHGMGNEGR